METEIWFNFLREAKRDRTYIFIVNGRLSEKSSDRYQKIRKTMSRVLRFVDLALMQTNSDAQRLLRLGINANKVRVTGNIKYDQSPVENNSVFVSYFSERFDIQKKNPLIVAASTHAPEERWILEAFKKVYKTREGNLPRLLIAPRHPERFDEVAELIKKSGLKLVRRSNPLNLEDVSADVILLDSIGELRQVFSLAEIVFVGGSLIPHGGQNILEPAVAKKAIVTGFYTMNFDEIVKTFEKNEAVARLPELDENEIPEKLAGVFTELLRSEEKRLKLAENAFKMLEKNRGATGKTMKFMRPILQVQATKNFASDKPANIVEKSEIPV
jgi:3-deoxy-D-manno-octulosonic-acid transferase